MRISFVFKSILLGTVFGLASATARAADLVIYSPQPVAEQDTDFILPAVSGINGKIEASGGFLRTPGTTIGHARINGSLSIPVTDRFGLQGDLAVFNTPTGVGGAGALHAFTRDPDMYLLGVAAAYVGVPGANLWAIGPEAELYLDRVSIEAWGGYAALNYDNVALADVTGVFGMVDLAYYISDDWRVSVGGRHVLGENQLRLATEYQVTSFDMPFSVTGEGRFATDGSVIATVGLKYYFGDPNKSLINRHRQDDPPDRAIDLFSAAGSSLYRTPGANPKTVYTDADCEAILGDAEAYFDGDECVVDDE